MQKEARISQIYLGTRQVVCTSVLQLSFAWSILRYVLPRLSRLAVSYDPQSPVFCMEHSEIWIAPSFKVLSFHFRLRKSTATRLGFYIYVRYNDT
ncbi:uncharacterized protein LOC119993692 isoform X2 [Tripterygium wilfordii]|uniref:uncharacterized protein LOC119993692 isoform X2 n=1 Tax=Tripterygium wilfordii TaxID=458696 RepID=UPI0018F85895|nr:uncharacterized protein LOC119993692 isoform X2 [Tripterygium wilfordii]